MSNRQLEGLADLREVAHAANDAIEHQDFHAFGDLMLHRLDACRRVVDEEVWRTQIVLQLRQQPFYAISQQDPFSFRATTKPRGYAGDAVLLDMLYRSPNIAEQLTRSTPAGQAIYNYWVNSPAAMAVRDRREYFLRQLVEIGMRKLEPEVLILACGHFREAESVMRCSTLQGLKITCLDQDPESCALVQTLWDDAGLGHRITVINKSVREVAKIERKFDLIYAAGLYDYLPLQAAQRLNAKLLSLVQPGGRIIVPNFLLSAPNRASMELLQDWWLIFRDGPMIFDLLGDPSTQRAGSVSYWEDAHASVGYAVFNAW